MRIYPLSSSRNINYYADISAIGPKELMEVCRGGGTTYTVSNETREDGGGLERLQRAT